MLLAGCTTSPSSFECSNDADCGNDGRCEPTGFCSFPDTGCASGYRYGDLAESLSNQCVIDDGTGSTSVDPGTSSASSSGDGPGSASSSSDSESTSSSTTDDPTTPIGDSSSGTTTGVQLFCLIEEFDVPPSPVDWFLYSESPTPPGIDQGQLRLPLDSAAGDTGVVAGLRAEEPVDLSVEGWARTIITEVPSGPAATMGLSITDDIIDNTFTRSIRVLSSSIRIESFDDGNLNVLAEVPFDPETLPVTLEILAIDAQVLYLAGGNDISQVYVEPTPPWFGTAYVAITAGNPSNNPVVGVPSYDQIEICGSF